MSDVSATPFPSPSSEADVSESSVADLLPGEEVPTQADYDDLPTLLNERRKHGGMSKWTIGLLGYQSWNVGGSAEAGTANNTYWQPFVSYVTKDAWTFTLDTESTFNWDARRASNPMNAIVSKLVYFGKMPVSLAVGVATVRFE